MEDIFVELAALIRQKRVGAFCVLTRVFGSSPRKEGTKMIVLDDGEIIGTIGGGSLEYKVIDEARAAMEENKPRYLSYVLEKDLGMKCGGSLEVYIEPFGKKPELCIFGAGHVGKNLMLLAANYGFDIHLIDGREEVMKTLSPPAENVKLHCEEPLAYIDALVTEANPYFVLVSHSHLLDEQILEKLIRLPHRYLGMIGSKAKIKKISQNLMQRGIREEELARVDMPIGIKFNAETPEELAISILAKLIDVKNSD